MKNTFDYDVLVIGSGFGGSVSALRLTEKGYRVGVVEAGRRFDADTLPKTSWNLRDFMWLPQLGLRGIQRLTLLKNILIFSGTGVGGGSLVYANTLYEPLEDFWSDPQWADVCDWKSELAPHYDQAKRMLGVEETPSETPADEVLKAVASRLGCADTYHKTPVGVWFGERDKEVADPYFGGAGPTRTGCIECGACIVGCRHNAKNTLDRNYLYLAERNGAEVHPEREVVDLVPLPGGGYEVHTARPGAWFQKRPKSFTAEQVIISGGVLGTLKLLFALKEKGRLPNLSERLGEVVRTNSEALLGMTSTKTTVDYTQGVAITSSIHPEAQTHIEPVRYPKGSNFMGLLATILVDGGGRIPRWVRFLGSAVTHPVTFLRSLSVRRWSERSIIFLVMQSRDNSLRVSNARAGRGGVRLTSRQGHGEPNPTYIPIANEAARIAAQQMPQPAFACSTISEAVLNVPSTAHILGGCCIGNTPESGVIDPYQRVFGHEGLHVADGSAVSANLGVNPSLTITAMTERAMSMWPNKGEGDQRPKLGEDYQSVPRLWPDSPAVPSDAIGALR